MAVDDDSKSAVQFQRRTVCFRQFIKYRTAVLDSGLETKIKFVP